MDKQPLQIASVIVVIRCQEKFLLVQRSAHDDIFPGRWQNMGGKIELGETVEEAIRREIQEEVGMNVDKNKPQFLQSYSWKKETDSPLRLGLVFLIDLPGKPEEHEIKLDPELADSGWFTLREAEAMNVKDRLIGKQSRTGTFGQLSQAADLRSR